MELPGLSIFPASCFLPSCFPSPYSLPLRPGPYITIATHTIELTQALFEHHMVWRRPCPGHSALPKVGKERGWGWGQPSWASAPLLPVTASEPTWPGHSLTHWSAGGWHTHLQTRSLCQKGGTCPGAARPPQGVQVCVAGHCVDCSSTFAHSLNTEKSS